MYFPSSHNVVFLPQMSPHFVKEGFRPLFLVLLLLYLLETGGSFLYLVKNPFLAILSFTVTFSTSLAVFLLFFGFFVHYYFLYPISSSFFDSCCSSPEYVIIQRVHRMINFLNFVERFIRLFCSYSK